MDKNYGCGIKYDEKLLASVQDVSRKIKQRKKKVMSHLVRKAEEVFKDIQFKGVNHGL